MKNKYLLLLFFLLGCVTPTTKTEIIEIDRVVSEKSFDYIPNSSDVRVDFEIDKNNLVGNLFLKEKVSYNVSKKEVKSFDPKDTFVARTVISCIFTLCISLPFNLYNYYSEKASLGEKRKFEEKDVKMNEYSEYNPDIIPEEAFSININDKTLKFKKASFSIPLDYFLNRKDEYFDYSLFYKGNKEVKKASIGFGDNSIKGTSPKYKQLLAMIEREQRKREIAEEKEREKESLSQKCETIKEGYENYYSNSSPSGYKTICHYSCERECKASYSYGSEDFKYCRTECKKLCDKCFK